jgi:hypothetical protein
MPHIIDFARYRNSKEITAINDTVGDHCHGCDYPADGIFYPDDDCDNCVDDDTVWDLEP